MSTSSAIAVERCPDLEMICPYEPGKPIEEVRRELGLAKIVKLASNENPLGPSTLVVDALERTDLQLQRYPDNDGRELRDALASALGVPPEQIVLGAGSAELMRLVADAYLAPGDEALMADLAFPVYETVTRLVGAQPVQVQLDGRLDHDLERMLDAVRRRTRLVFLASPNNPTGRAIPTAELAQFLDRLPPTVLCVLDLAYAEYVDGLTGEALRLLARHPNLVLLHTFSKVYGLAGLRIGYAVAHPEVAGWLARVRMPFATSTAAQVAARIALDDKAHVQRSIALNGASRAQLARGVEALGLRAHRSDANFVLVEGELASDTLARRLLEHGMVVRPMRHPRLARAIRVTTGTAEQMSELLEALGAIVASARADQGAKSGRDGHAASAGVARPQVLQAGTGHETRRPALLLVDPAGTRSSFAAAADDFELCTAVDAAEALSLLTLRGPRVVVAVDDGRADGLELMRRVKAAAPWTSRILIVRSHDAAVFARALNEELCWRCYAQPCDPELLRADLERARDRATIARPLPTLHGLLGC